MSNDTRTEKLEEVFLAAKAVVATSYESQDDPRSEQVRVPPNRKMVNSLEEKIEALE